MQKRPIIALIWVVAIAILLAGCALSGTPAGELTGTVRYESGDPIADAVVAIGSLSATTNAAGAFTLKPVAFGAHTLTVRVGGQVVKEQAVNVTARLVTVAVSVPNPPQPPPEPEPQPEPEPEPEPEPQPTPTWTLVYSQDFSGPGTTPADYGWVTDSSHLSRWSIAEADGKRWIRGTRGSATSIYVKIPELATATKVKVEYTVTNEVNGTFGVNILANEFPGGSSRRGGTNYWASSHSGGLNLRKITNNNYPGGDDLRQYSFSHGQGTTRTILFEYDSVAKTINLYVDGSQVGGTWQLQDTQIITGDGHDMLILYTSTATARWTGIKVWVQ